MKALKLAIFLFLIVQFSCQPVVSKIDREILVSRHQVKLDSINKMSPLSVGNGHFCYTADITGMQTFPGYYKEGIPLTTMAEWGWHSFPNTEEYQLLNTFLGVDSHGKKVKYPINTEHPGSTYLRSNQHQITLGLIGLQMQDENNNLVTLEQLQSIDQILDLWKGTLISKFKVEGELVIVTTIAHPKHDQLSFKIQSSLLNKNRIAVKILFPYASGAWGADPADFENDDLHETGIISVNDKEVLLFREMDAKKYYCKITTSVNSKIESSKKHHFLLSPSASVSEMNINISFAENKKNILSSSFEKTLKANIKSWEKYWQSGGIVDLSESKDLRWRELERRIVLSQYLTAIQSRQKYPPQETGLTCNSWYGKFHLEMHWWHSVHFALWDRPQFLEKTLDYYFDILPEAQKYAKMQGYKGARWPKMTDPRGIDSPSGIGPLLIWQQPHPIYYSELLYRQNPTKETLEKYSGIIQNTAEFMASYAHWNEERRCFELGPPLISAREFSGRTYFKNQNPTFELAYWTWGLHKANEWRERMGLKRIGHWDHIADNMAPWPINNGVYVEQETVLVADGGHPCQLAAYGLLPETGQLDKEIMRKTLNHVMQNWDWESTWGWDYPMIAMTAARLGEPEIAINALLKDVTKNTYLPNGHNYQRDNLKIYLPGNGGLLSAIAMMCAGWDGVQDNNAPGFPDDGSWVVKWEGLEPNF
jgi:hypothetical protein